jgi:AcrR family transcriptional regulator
VSTRVKVRAVSVQRTGRQGGHVEEMQRRRLLSAMVEVVAELGLEDASVGRICKRAGVSRRTFYELFDGRDECLLAAFDAAVERIAHPVLTAFEAGDSWRERVRNALTVLLEQLDAEPDVARLCVIETLKAGPRVSERRAGVLAALVAAVEQGRIETRPPNEPPPLTGQGVVGGALSVIHGRLQEAPSNGRLHPLSDLAGALMAMIVHPYMGSAAARHELDRPASKMVGRPGGAIKDPFKDLSIRFTYRTARVLATIAAEGGRGSYPSNRLIADTSGIADEGQMSRLLTRLQRAGLIENRGEGQPKGESNAWQLTERGDAVNTALIGR